MSDSTKKVNEESSEETSNDYDKLIEIASAYVFDVLEEEGFLEDKTDVEREEIMDVADCATAMSLVIASKFASFNFDKICKVDELARNEKYDEAHNMIFDIDE